MAQPRKKPLIMRRGIPQGSKPAIKRWNIKTLLIGDGGVGKTSLVDQFVSASFDVDYKITIGVNVMNKIVKLTETENVNLVINDVAGQPRFEVMRQTFYLGAQAVLAVYDLTRKQSLDNLVNVWLPELKSSNPSKPSLPPMQVLVIGNKSDLEDLRSISEEEIEDALASMKEKFPESKFIGSIETSAKDNIAVDDAFIKIANEYVLKLKEMYPTK
ncbi:MAG: Rab family GTPase [Candidatus Hodarchaeales archaeon]|jgi:small GTP-binding protein